MVLSLLLASAGQGKVDVAGGKGGKADSDGLEKAPSLPLFNDKMGEEKNPRHSSNARADHEDDFA